MCVACEAWLIVNPFSSLARLRRCPISIVRNQSNRALMLKAPAGFPAGAKLLVADEEPIQQEIL